MFDPRDKTNPVLLCEGIRTGHTDWITTLVVSPDSKSVASGSRDNTIVLWDTADGGIVQQWVPPYDNRGYEMSLAFSPNSRSLVSAGRNDRRVAIMDLDAGPLQMLRGHIGGVTSCAWSPGGDVIASGSDDGTVRLWDASTSQPLHVLKHATVSFIQLIEFSPNGRWLLTSCVPSSYYIWNVASGTGQQLRMSSPEACNSLIAAAFNPSSTRAIVASPSGVIEIFETDGARWAHVVPGCKIGKLGCEATGRVAFSPNWSLALTEPVRDTHPTKIWDTYTGVELLSLEGHKNLVLETCFSPCGKYVASASWDQIVRLWRTRDGSCIAAFTEHSCAVRHVVFSADGESMASGADDGSVIIRRMRDVLPTDEWDP